MNANRHMSIAIGLIAALVCHPAATAAQATTTFGGQAAALRVGAIGIGLALSDTGPLPATGGNLQTSLAKVDIPGLVSAGLLSSAASGGGTSSQSQSSVADLTLLGGVITADLVKANSSATCDGGQASVSGSSELVGLVVAGQAVANVSPNLALFLPGGITVIVNEQTGSPTGNLGSMIVNALRVSGPTIDIVVASAASNITCAG